jgi:hypothetical protein
MPRVSRLRLRQLEWQLHVDEPPIGWLFFLIPNLWAEEDREAFFNPKRGEALEDLVERRTGVRPVRDPNRTWAIVPTCPRKPAAGMRRRKRRFWRSTRRDPCRCGSGGSGHAVDDTAARA